MRAGAYRSAKVMPWPSVHLHRDRPLDRRPLAHAPPVVGKLWKPCGVDPVQFPPLRDREQIWVADRVGIAKNEGTFEHGAFDEIETVTDRLWNLSLHRLDRRWIVGPAVAAHAMGMRDVHGRTQIR